MRTCPWCKEGFELVLKNEHLTCLECRFYLVRKGEPGWDEGFGTRIGKDEYWRLYDPSTEDRLVTISPARSITPQVLQEQKPE
jgi:hypothetical protein